MEVYSSEFLWLFCIIPGLDRIIPASDVPIDFINLFDKVDPETQERIIDLVRNRLHSQRKLLISSVPDQREDRPADFLEVGLNRSLAVCRVARYFPRKDFQIFIDDIKQLIEKSENFKNFDSIPKLQEIFLIPNETADEIFTTEVKSKLTELKSKLPENEYSLESSKILLDALKNLTENQLAQLNPIPVGTGFLVGATHLLTNYHVLFDEEVASQCVAQFHYEESLGADQKTIDYELDPDTLFIREPSLDYTLVQLKFNQFTRQAGHHFGWLQLVEDDANIIPGLNADDVKQLQIKGFELSEEEKEGDNVILIHHPKGRQKKIDLTNNRVIKGGLYKSFLRYTAESDYGSSGCPVFNTKWELVALNHAAILQSDGKTFVKQGVRICQIVADLKQKSASFPKLKSFIEDFVVTAEQLIYPPLPAALEFDGERSYVDCGNDKSLNIDEAITIEAWVKNNDPNSDGVIVYRGGCFDKSGYCIWRYANKIRVELQNSKRKIIVDTDNVVLDDQSWYHVAFTWDKKERNTYEQFEKRETYKTIAGITIYINGEPQPISTISKQEEFKDFDGIGTAEENLTIGRAGSIEKIIDNFVNSIKNDPGSRSIIHNYFERPRANLRLEIARQYYFNGAIAEVRLWKVARTQDQIKNNRFRRLNKQNLGQDWSNLVGYWRLEEAVGNRAYNLKFENSIKGENQESAKNEPDKAEQKFGLRLYGLSDYIDCGKLNYLKNDKTEITEITIEAWVRNYGGESDGMIIHQGGGWDEDGYSIWMYKGKIRVELQNHPKKIVVDTYDKFPFDQNEPKLHHVAFTWEKVSGIQIYIDGETKGSTFSPDGNCKSFSEFSDSIGIPKVNLNIGRSQNHGRYFNGCIAEVRIWNVARNPEQIKENMSQPLSEQNSAQDWSNLVGYWRLDEEEGDKAANLVSDDKYGLVHGGRWEKADTLLEQNQGAYGVVSQAKIMRASQYPTLPLPFGLTFNESNDRVEFSSGQEENSVNKVTDSITVEAWVKHKFGNCSIVKRSDDDDNGYSLSWYEGKIRVKLQAVKKEKIEEKEKIVVYTEENFPDDRLWHHVAFTLDKDSHEISIYIDGRVQNCVVEGKCKTIISTMQAKSIGLFTGPFNPPKKPLIIGCKEQGTDYYNIEIAEVRLWNTARTQDQIQKHMSRRLSKQDSDRLSEQEQKKQEEQKEQQEHKDQKDQKEPYWSNLIGYWRLDDGTEDNQQVFDQTLNQNHGTMYRSKNVSCTATPANSTS